MQLPPDGGAPPHWLAYFTIGRPRLGRVAHPGARRRICWFRPWRSHPGGFLVASDPQGAVFALFEGEVDP